MGSKLKINLVVIATEINNCELHSEPVDDAARCSTLFVKIPRDYVRGMLIAVICLLVLSIFVVDERVS
jgi:hypothetical protein